MYSLFGAHNFLALKCTIAVVVSLKSSAQLNFLHGDSRELKLFVFVSRDYDGLNKFDGLGNIKKVGLVFA